MNKFIINSIIVASLAVNSGLAFAQIKTYNASKSNTGPSRTEGLREAVKGKSEAVKAAVEEKRETLKNAVVGRKEAVKTAQTEFRAKLETEREVFKQKVEATKEEFKQKREVQKEELKARLEKIKDEKKKAAVERLDNRFTEINAKQTNHLLNTLTRLEELLVKVSSRADKAQANGRDVSAVRAAVEKAKTAIAGARTVLEGQLKKTYPVQITDESKLKSAVAVAREALNKDLKTAREAVQKAHKAVVEANRLLKGVQGMDKLKESTPVPPPAVETPTNTETLPSTTNQ